MIIIGYNNQIKTSSKIDDFFDKTKLLNHQIFKKLNYWTDFKTTALYDSDDSETKMIREFFKIYIYEISNELFDYINSDKYKNQNETRHLLETIINNIQENATNTGIPKKFLDKYHSLQEPHRLSLQEGINRILKSHMYQDCLEKNLAILDLFLYYFVYMTLTIEAVIPILNEEAKYHLG